MAPKPPAFGASRRSRDVPLSRAATRGPDMAPKPPAFGASRRSRDAPLIPRGDMGPRPPARVLRRNGAVNDLLLRARRMGPGWPRGFDRSVRLGGAVAGLGSRVTGPEATRADWF